jgi:hypothetical protein
LDGSYQVERHGSGSRRYRFDQRQRVLIEIVAGLMYLAGIINAYLGT